MTFLRSLLLLLSQIDLFWPPPPPSSPIPHEKNSCLSRETAAEEGGKGARERETGNASHLSPQKNRPSAKRTCTEFGTAASALKTSEWKGKKKEGEEAQPPPRTHQVYRRRLPIARSPWPKEKEGDRGRPIIWQGGKTR